MRPRRLVGAVLVLAHASACGDEGVTDEPRHGDAAGSSTGTAPSTGGGGGDSTVASVGGAGGGSDAGGDGGVESLTRLDLGSVAIDLLHTFEMPDRALGFTAFARGPTNLDLLGIHQLRAPAGGDVVFEYAVAGHSIQVFGNEGLAAAANPQSDLPQAMPVQAGEWSIRIGDGGQGLVDADASVWVRRTNDGEFHGGALDVNVLLAPGTVDAAYMAEVLAAFFPYAGIEQGEVAYYEIDAAYGYIDTYAEYLEMLESSAGIGTVPAVNVFVVGDFDKGDFKAAHGVAPGIPGSAVEHGTPLSGVAFQPSGDPAHDATLLIHEIGHLAGLFHTSEIKVDENDPLDDTPECPFDVMSADPTACPDEGNPMFPVAYGNVAFTPHQLDVVHGSAIYRGSLEVDGPPAPPVSPPPRSSGAHRWRRLPAPLAQARIQTRADVGARAMGALPLDRILGGVWCGSDVDHVALVIASARQSAARTATLDALDLLRERAADAERSPLVRARALEALVRASR